MQMHCVQLSSKFTYHLHIKRNTFAPAWATNGLYNNTVDKKRKKISLHLQSSGAGFKVKQWSVTHEPHEHISKTKHTLSMIPWRGLTDPLLKRSFNPVLSNQSSYIAILLINGFISCKVQNGHSEILKKHEKLQAINQLQISIV